ncbi:MAG: DUF177 domain-containing protein [Desulfobacterales bacterium]
MFICVDDIKDQGLSIEFEEKPEKFPILDDLTHTADCVFHSPLKFKVRAIRVKEMVKIEGRLETSIRLTCSRCLELFESPLVTNFVLTYAQEQPETARNSDGGGIELSAEEAGLITFSGTEIDLKEALQEQAVMSIPMRPLCAETCKGLCSKCGANLNDGDCGCRKSSLSTKFAVLKSLKFGDNE